MRGTSALGEFEYWVSERGFRGLSLRPFPWISGMA
jgi:hypothetical protein